MNFNQAFDLAAKSATLGYDNVRKLAEINMATWEKMVAAQMTVMNTCFETTSKQMELLETVKHPEELFGKQVELTQELGEKLTEQNKEVLEVLNKTRDEYVELAEAGAQQVKTQVEEMVSVAQSAQKAA